MADLVQSAHVTSAGKDVFGREVLVTFIESLEGLRFFPLPPAPFVLFIAAEFDASPATELERLAERVVAEGAVYVMSWGPGCDRLEGLVDSMTAPPPGEDVMILTTSYPDDTLHTALNFATKFAVPDERYEDACRTVLIVAAGRKKWFDETLVCLKEALPK